jgi:hypothetical protein
MDPSVAIKDNPVPARSRLPLFLLGVLLFIAGPAIYATQMLALHQFKTPWHVPLLATVGAILMLLSVVQRPGIVRIIGLVLFTAICGFEWFAMLVVFPTPPYTGPVAVGQPMPAFATTYADGASFSDKDLANGKTHLLVFYRGHW